MLSKNFSPTLPSGGTLKRAVARANLTRTVRGHIISPLQVFEFCQENVTGITVMWCSEAQINVLADEKLSERYSKAKTVRNTQQYHHFSVVPGTTNVNARVMSGDAAFFTHRTCSA